MDDTAHAVSQQAPPYYLPAGDVLGRYKAGAQVEVFAKWKDKLGKEWQLIGLPHVSVSSLFIYADSKRVFGGGPGASLPRPANGYPAQDFDDANVGWVQAPPSP